jgi:hypothetical protein
MRRNPWPSVTGVALLGLAALQCWLHRLCGQLWAFLYCVYSCMIFPLSPLPFLCEHWCEAVHKGIVCVPVV